MIMVFLQLFAPMQPTEKPIVGAQVPKTTVSTVSKGDLSPFLKVEWMEEKGYAADRWTKIR
jgi:hypothetical protein